MVTLDRGVFLQRKLPQFGPFINPRIYCIIKELRGGKMNIDTATLVPISEANQNFSKVARLVDQHGSAVIMKNNEPRYVIIEFNRLDMPQEASDSEVLAASKQIMERNRHVYEELAK